MGAPPWFGEGIGGKRERGPERHGRREHEERRDDELRQKERALAGLDRRVEIQEEKREAPRDDEAKEGECSRGHEGLGQSRQRLLCRMAVQEIGREPGA